MARDALRPMSDVERLKYEAAEQLGLTDRLLQVGWAGLTAGETGKIGGRAYTYKQWLIVEGFLNE